MRALAALAAREWPMTIMKLPMLVALVALAAPLAASAQGTPAGNAQAGSQKNAMCSGCHGIQGWRTAYPEVYSVPKIGGQHPAYIVKALQEYRAGERSHPSMRAIAGSLSDADIANLAAYYARGGIQTASK